MSVGRFIKVTESLISGSVFLDGGYSYAGRDLNPLILAVFTPWECSLRREHEEAQQHVTQLDQAIQVIERLVSRNADSTQKITTAPARTVMSDATRRKLSNRTESTLGWQKPGPAR
jgi:hypothetical protein